MGHGPKICPSVKTIAANVVIFENGQTPDVLAAYKRSHSNTGTSPRKFSATENHFPTSKYSLASQLKAIKAEISLFDVFTTSETYKVDLRTILDSPAPKAVPTNALIESLPTIPILLANTKTNAIIDTGAVVSLMSTQFFHKCGLTTMLPAKIKLRSVSNQLITPLGVSEKLAIVTGKSKTLMALIVTDNCPYDVLLGSDWIKWAKISIDLANARITIPDDDGTSSIVPINCTEIASEAIPVYHFTAKQQYIVPAESQCVVAAKCADNPPRPIYLASAAENLHVAKGITDNSSVSLLVANFTSKPITIQQNMTLAVGCMLVSQDIQQEIDSIKFPASIPANIKKEFKDLIQANIEIFQAPTSVSDKLQPHTIDLTDSKPIKTPMSRVSHHDHSLIETEVKKLLENGLISSSSSPYSSPIVLITKKDGFSRLCIDYRKLNAITIKESSSSH
jgi:hypothetical protein